MIITGINQKRIINPQHVVGVELEKGRTAVFANGETNEQTKQVNIKNFRVKTPYAVKLIMSNRSISYINFKTYEEALNELARIVAYIMGRDAFEEIKIKEELRKVYVE